MKHEKRDKVKIIGNKAEHCFPIGTMVTIITVTRYHYEAISSDNQKWWVDEDDVEKIEFKTNKNTTIMNQLMRDVVETAADELLVANNTFTTLELKLKLRKDEPNFYWTQSTVSTIMDEFAQNGTFVYTDNGTFRTYSDPLKQATVNSTKSKPKTVKTPKQIDLSNALRISRTKALDLMKNSKGHFFTVLYTVKDGSERQLNGQFVKDQKNSQLGYVLVKESCLLKAKSKEPIRNVNLQTLKALKIGGQAYKVR